MLAGHLFLAAEESYTSDEFAHLYAGTRHLYAGDYDINQEHPPLIKILSALPFLFFNHQAYDQMIHVKTGQFQGGWQLVDAMTTGHRYLCRLAILLFNFFLFVWIVFAIHQRWGTFSALSGGIVLLLLPTLQAHFHFICFDVPAFLLTTALLLLLFDYADHPGVKQICTVILAGASVISVKFTALPIWIFGLVWICAMHLIKRPRVDRSVNICLHGFLYISGSILLLTLLSQGNLADLLKGIIERIAVMGHPQKSMFFGHAIFTQWYYPVLFLLKENLLFIIGGIFSLGFLMIRFRNLSKASQYQVSFLVSMFLINGFLVVTSRFQVGVRHLLVLYPYLFLLIMIGVHEFKESALSSFSISSRRIIILLIGGLIVLDTIRMGLIFPHLISYSNWLVGNPHNIRKIASDSNVGWGTNYYKLADWIDKTQTRENDCRFFILNRIGWPGSQIRRKPGVYHRFELAEFHKFKTPSYVIFDDYYLQNFRGDPVIETVSREGQFVQTIGYDLLIFKIPLSTTPQQHN